jgi:hypothetical protein
MVNYPYYPCLYHIPLALSIIPLYNVCKKLGGEGGYIMIDAKQNGSDAEYIELTKKRVADKVDEYQQLLHEQKKIEMMLERVKGSINHLNGYLEAEGQSPVKLRAAIEANVVNKPGNRSKDYPLRKMKWEGMSINQIVQAFLGASPDTIYHANEIIPEVYEIQTDVDLKKVSISFVSALRRGVMIGLWDRIPGNMYKALARQGELV